MSTALATQPKRFDQLPSTSVASDNYDDLTKGADFLQRIQLYTKGKAIDKGLIPPGQYGVPQSDDDITSLGNSIDILPLARRPKAVDFSDKEAIITVYDPESDEFQRVQQQSGTKDSGCMYGIEFLVYERSTKQFYTMFFGTKSQRPEARKLFPFLPESSKDGRPHPATMKTRYVEAKFSWHVPVVQKCSTPIEVDEMKACDEIMKFLNPKDGGAEKVEAPSNNRAR